METLNPPKNSPIPCTCMQAAIHCLDSSIIKIFLFFLTRITYTATHSYAVPFVSQIRSKVCSLTCLPPSLPRPFQVGHHAEPSNQSRPSSDSTVSRSPCVLASVLEVRRTTPSLPAANTSVIQMQP